MNKKIMGIIPARYKSSRYPGKPICDIFGKPMIWWVYQQCLKVKSLNEVYIATDDKRIQETCLKYNLKCVMTMDDHLTGTDRLSECASKLDADLYVNIQGDEPVIEPDTIQKCIDPMLKNENYMVTNLMTKIKDPVDLLNFTIPKVIVNEKSEAIYLSRSPIPYPKGETEISYYKQVCAYCFTKDSLEFFASKQKGPLEQAEDIELLRFIENNIKVKIVEVDSETIAVDTPKDLERVKKHMKQKGIA